MSAPAGLPRLLAGVGAGMESSAGHQRRHGPLPTLSTTGLIEVVERSGLRGRGGADFPTAAKLRAVAARRKVSAVVVNGSETEPASRKDVTLLEHVPHLVLDGAILCAHTVQADSVFVRMSARAGAAIDSVETAIAERAAGETPIALVVGPDGYVGGEETAVIHQLESGIAKPTYTPPRPYEKGYRNRPTLIQNAETLAQIALIARYGPAWYRQLGTDEDPGSTLLTVSGAVAKPGVYELSFGTPLHQLIDAVGGPSEPLQAVLVGGYFGNWLSIEDAWHTRLARESLREHGASLGAGVLVALPARASGLAECARIASYLADQSAGQCGPCIHGLRAIADGVQELADGTASAGTLERVRRWCGEVDGRGACHHPNGAARFVLSSLRVFSHELAAGEPASRRRRQAV